jgi:phage terminase large subunit-like protein
MVITEGDRIDDGAILDYLRSVVRTYRVQSVVFDPYSAFMMMGAVEAEGVTVYRMAQTGKYYSAPMKDFSKAITEGRILHDGSPWLRYCLQNVRVDEDRSGYIRPARNKSIDKIDAAISTLMAFSQAAAQPAEARTSVYDTRGIFVLDP